MGRFDETGAFTWTHANQLGSANAATNAAGRLSRYRDTGAGGAWRYQSYDARGNTSNDGVHGFAYDRSERPVTITGGASGSFVYDAHGRRVKQTLDSETIYSVYGLDGTLIYRDNATSAETTDYISVGAHTVARVYTNGGFKYQHGDHLGSTAAETRSDGSVRWRERYTPFGEAIHTPSRNDDQPGFTGHIRDAATGLTYAQARYYNPVTAEFLSPDPVGFADMGPGYFNRYTYTMNDPVNATDPTGEFGVPGALVGGIIGGGAELVRQRISGEPINLGRAAIAAGGGALAGATGAYITAGAAAVGGGAGVGLAITANVIAQPAIAAGTQVALNAEHNMTLDSSSGEQAVDLASGVPSAMAASAIMGPIGAVGDVAIAGMTGTAGDAVAGSAGSAARALGNGIVALTGQANLGLLNGAANQEMDRVIDDELD